jgi:endonuclease/exonuclease/phosphatase family metal-dependent hydrolase
MAFKITSWNIEHADRLLGPNPTALVAERRRRIRATLEEINPDIICMIEGPRGEIGVDAFATQVLEGAWLPVRLDATAALGANDRKYQQLGAQWIWFLVRPAILAACRIQDPVVWQSFTNGKSWAVNRWGELEPSQGSHYRHPQLLIYALPDGTEIEFIGVHLKSKINQMPITRTASGALGLDYVKEALRARTALAIEARNVRAYIGAKFDQRPNPGVVVMGDCNDGPGQDLFEERYLFFDLIQNIQGEVLLAERFFNHALFDFPGDLRWTARYRDEVLNIPESRNPLLLDHILVSQPLCNGSLPVQVNAHAGSVEHEAFARGNAGASATRRTSDHRPVSCVFEDVAP